MGYFMLGYSQTEKTFKTQKSNNWASLPNPLTVDSWSRIYLIGSLMEAQYIYNLDTKARKEF